MESLGPYELNTAVLGDCLEVMRQIPDNSVDSIVADPPYGLGNDPDMVEMLTHWLNDKDYDTGSGFMNKSWDIVPGPSVWRECFRIMKPGGCLMAFGGTRTCDLLSIAIRLAGFQRFDSLCWLHGQGFGKGADVSKKLDAMAGAEREVIGAKVRIDGRIPANEKPQDLNGNIYGKGIHDSRLHYITAPATEAAKSFSGYRSQLKPAHEVILCFWKPREKSFANNALVHGVAGLWIDGCRIPTNGELVQCQKASKDAKFTTPLTHDRPREYTTQGRYPSNCLLSHHPACVRVGVRKVRGSNGIRGSDNGNMTYGNGQGLNRPVTGQPVGYADPDGYEVVEAWECVDSCPVKILDEQAGERKSGQPSGRRTAGHSGFFIKEKGTDLTGYGDSGSASRFFYTPKAPPREKWFYCEICDDCYPYKERDDHAHGKPKGKREHQVAHPTVKPVTICNYALGVLEYLCRLTKTPTGGIILDPFAGSGTTGLAAIANGRPFILIENDPIYHRIAEKRIKEAMAEPRQLELL